MTAGSTNFYLKEDIYFCTDQERLFFLDLGRDKYLTLSKEQSILFKQLVDSLSPTAPHEAPATKALSSAGAATFSTHLASRGILTSNPYNGKPADETCWLAATANLIEGDIIERPTVEAKAVCRFLAASTLASVQLRLQSLELTVKSVKARRVKNRARQATPGMSDLRQIIMAFRTLRPIYPRKYLCLYDSLALMEFLSFYRIYPRWVFGITAEPFHAHCWVEDGGVVYNDLLDRIRRYRPIMVV